MGAIAFRALGAGDLQQVFLWLGRPHVSKWYAPAPSSYAEVAAKYGPRTQPGNAVRAFVVTLDGADVGYIQTYPVDRFPEYAGELGCGPGTAGMDLFIADPWRMNHGLGSSVVRRFVDEVVFAEPDVAACIAGPSEGNAASIRAFEKAGFTRWKRVRAEGAEPECVLRRERPAFRLRISPIDLARHAAECIAFRRDAYVASFGTPAGIEEEMGADNALYLDSLTARIGQVPEGNSHLWDGERIVGQTEMRLVDGEPRVGYVNLFYLLPEFRGRGLGRMLHEHAVGVFERLGRRTLRLSVSTQNAAAIAFYRKLGWVTVGTRPNREPMEIMEFTP
jgi:ribosomal protein S18 acetylase RimI-like enzyme